MAEWDTAYINDLPDSAFACIEEGGKQEDGRTVPRSLRKYPHHDSSGAVDLPHLRNALSRVAQEDTTSCGVQHLRAHAKEEGVGQSAKIAAVKFVEGSDTRIEGLAIPFGGPLGGKDFHGEDFGPDLDIVPSLYPNGRPLLYNHGMHKDMDVEVIGRQIEHEQTAEGIFARGELDKSAKYHETVAKLVRQGKLFFSSGAIPHLVKTNADGHITRWPWSELSLTPTPANPDAVVYAVKMTDHLEHLTSAGIEVPDAIKQSSEDGTEPEPFAVHAERLSLDLDAFADRAEQRRDWRVKSGRRLSAANRAEIAEVVEAIDRLGERRARLADLIADPAIAEAEAADVAAKAAEAKALEAEYLRIESRILGVPV